MEKSCIWNFNYVENENRLPQSWEEYCENYPIKGAEHCVSTFCDIIRVDKKRCNALLERMKNQDRNMLPDHATACAVLALCQLVQLRNCYNGDWVPDWDDGDEIKYCIDFAYGDIREYTSRVSPLLLHFKSEELRDEFLRNFRPLILKLKPLYGIKEGVDG